MSHPTIPEEVVERMARGICRVQLNGGDPGQPAVRWNGTEMEPQEFPAWHDYRDEARGAFAAIGPEYAVVPVDACQSVSEATEKATAAERKRCAAIARAEFESPGYSGAGECIATAIEKEPG